MNTNAMHFAPAGNLEDPLRVVYDISTLAIGHYRPRAKTGIFRVVENVGRRLAGSTDLDLAVTATFSLQTYKEAKDYLTHTGHFQGRPLLFPFVPNQRTSLALAVGAFCDRLQQPARTRRVARFATWKAVQRLSSPRADRRVLSNGQFDIFHSPFTPLPAEMSTGVPVRFLTVYDVLPVLMPQYFPAQMCRLFARILERIRPSDWILCISDSTKRDFCEVTGFDPDRVTVTYLGCDRDIFFPQLDPERQLAVRQRYRVPDGPYILSLNTREPRKNTRTTMEAFTSLAASGAIGETSLVLAGGSGWHEDPIVASITAARKTAPRNEIIETGFVDDQDLAALYSGACMFVFIPLYEGFGLPALEAMTCGVPVVTSNTSSLPEVVGDAAITVDPLDVEAVAEAMGRVYCQSALREDMAARSLRRARQFSWDRCATETVAAYRRAVA